MLRTLLFAALLGVVTANNDTTTNNPGSNSETTTQGGGGTQTETTTQAPATLYLQSGSITMGEQYGTAAEIINSTTKITAIKTGIVNGFKETINSTSLTSSYGVNSIEKISFEAGSVVVAYTMNMGSSNANSAFVSANTGTKFKTDVTAALRTATGTNTLTVASATASPVTVGNRVTSAFTCLAKRYSDNICATLVTAATDVTFTSGATCVEFPAATRNANPFWKVDSFYPSGSIRIASGGGGTAAACNNEQTYSDANLNGGCVAADNGGTGWATITCTANSGGGGTTAAPTSNAIGAGLSAFTAVVAFLMM